MLILSGADVRAVLPMPEAIELMKRAFAALARGDAEAPARIHLSAPGNAGVTLVMPALVGGEAPGLAVKVVSVFDRNPARGLARIQSAVIVLEPGTGRPIAVVEGRVLTAIRTAAASGAATDLLARPAAATLAVLGAGVQARSHVTAMRAVRPIREVRLFSRTRGKVDALIAELKRSPGTGPSPADQIDFVHARSAAEAVRGADIVCTTTTSSTPVFDDRDLAPGAHINAVGSFTPSAREVPGATVERAWVVVDEREAARAEAGDLILAREEGRIGEDHVRAALGELVLDPDLRPDDSSRPTLFKSVGVAAQDAVAAAAAVTVAERRGLGTRVAW